MNDEGILKAAVARQIKGLGGVESAATLVSMGKTQLSNFGNPERTERIPAIVAMRMDAVAGDPVILSAMAGMIGYRIVRTDDSSGEIMTALGDTAAKAGALLASGYAAAADGTFTATERRGMAADAMALIDRLNALLRAIGSEGGE